MIDAGGCVVWWASLDAHHDALQTVLAPAERERAARLRRAEDQARSILGATLLRLAVSGVTGTPPARVTVERTCPTCAQPHWRPTLPGTGLHASISHSGDWVAVALTTAGPVGVDVERVADIDVAGLARQVLHPDERAAGGPPLADFYRYWTRKEAVVKATGDGIQARLAEVHVSAPHESPALLAYPGRPGLAAYLVDLAPRPGHAAALALLVDRPVPVDERDGAPLLGTAHRVS